MFVHYMWLCLCRIIFLLLLQCNWLAPCEIMILFFILHLTFTLQNPFPSLFYVPFHSHLEKSVSYCFLHTTSIFTLPMACTWRGLSIPVFILPMAYTWRGLSIPVFSGKSTYYCFTLHVAIALRNYFHALFLKHAANAFTRVYIFLFLHYM